MDGAHHSHNTTSQGAIATEHTSDKAKTVFIKTYGCQMNVYDTERMADVLVSEGYTSIDSPDEADLIILNTCHIREKAAEKVYSDIGRLKPIKAKGRKQGRDVRIAVAGCVAQAEGKEIISRAPVVDLVFGPQQFHRLPEHLKALKKQKHVIDTDDGTIEKFNYLKGVKQNTTTNVSGQHAVATVSRFLTIQEGCDKFCAFCVVPYTRGMEVSRPLAQVLEDAKNLIEIGVKDITLLGQNVNAYHGLDPNGEPISLATLIGILNEIDALKRIRYTTSHPKDMTDDLVKAHGTYDKLMPYLHLPIQAGSDKILKAMNRHHTREQYLSWIDKVRTTRPGIALSSDFIVGFPGETEADFEETCHVADQVKFASAYSFKYSPRPGTPAADNADQISEEVKTKRLARLQDILGAHQKTFNESHIGTEMELILERPGKNEDQRIGRSPYNQSVYVTLGTLAQRQLNYGDIVTVEIVSASQSALRAKIVG